MRPITTPARANVYNIEGGPLRLRPGFAPRSLPVGLARHFSRGSVAVLHVPTRLPIGSRLRCRLAGSELWIPGCARVAVFLGAARPGVVCRHRSRTGCDGVWRAGRVGAPHPSCPPAAGAGLNRFGARPGFYTGCPGSTPGVSLVSRSFTNRVYYKTPKTDGGFRETYSDTSCVMRREVFRCRNSLINCAINCLISCTSGARSEYRYERAVQRNSTGR